MKTINRSRILCCLLLLLPVFLPAKGPGGGPGNGGMRNGPMGSGPPETRSTPAQPPAGSAGLATLDQFLSLDDAALEQLEATIRRIRQMTPEERRSLQDQIARFRQMPDTEKKSLQTSWGQLDREIRKAWRDYMFALEPSEREAVREEMQRIPAEERTNWRISRLTEEGFLEKKDDPS